MSDDKTTGKTDEDLLVLARDQYRAADDACDDNYRDALADLTFLKGGVNQWDAEAVNVRTIQKRPMITVNVLPTYLHQVTNDQRMNTPSIKVHPVGDKADVETAKVRQGMIRHIEYDSNADVAYDTAVNNAAAIGFGWFGLITDYEREDSDHQKIMFRRIRNPLSVKIDPLSVEPDGSDMQYAFIECLMSKAEFKRKYPKANACNDAFFASDTQTDWTAWITAEAVLVCEWYCIEKEEVEVVTLSNGDTGFIDKLVPNSDETKLPADITITKRRRGTRSTVMWYRITGADILERTEIKCKWIPLFPVYGDEIDVQGQVVRSGIIRNAKGPAQMYNVFMTSATEEVALRGKNPWVMAEGQDEGHEDEWQQINVTPLPYATYKPVALGDVLAPPPQRQPMADVPTGHLAMAMHSADNIKKTTGLFDASLGARGNATSGKQELAQQKEGDVANYHYVDGLMRSLRHAGRCINCMIPHYYDAQRVVRIIGEDDGASHVTINQPNPEYVEGGAVDAVLNDMSCDDYDITVSSGPSFTTMRQEAGEFFANALSASKDPAQASVFGYLAIKNQDIKDGETATKMVATLLPAPAKAVLDEANGDKNGEEEEMIPTAKGPLPVSQVPAVLQQMEQQLQVATEALQKADADKKAEAVARAQAEVLKEENRKAEIAHQGALDVDRIQIESKNAETLRFKAETERMKAADDADKREIELLQAHHKTQLDARTAEQAAISGDSQAFKAWEDVLESETRIRVAEITARSGERRAELAAQRKAQKPPAP